MHVRTLVIGANVAGNSFVLWLSRLNQQETQNCLIIERRTREQCTRKPCGSGLTSYAQQHFEWEDEGKPQDSLLLRFGVDSFKKVSIPPVVFTTRGRILDHLRTLREKAGDHSETWYTTKVVDIDFDKRTAFINRNGNLIHVHYRYLILASGAASVPIRLLNRYLGRQNALGMTAFQFKFHTTHETLPIISFNRNLYGGGYAWAWNQHESGMLDLGIGYPDDFVLPGDGHSRSRAKALASSLARDLGVTVPEECRGEFCPIPTAWLGFNPVPGVYTIGDAAGSAFYPTGEGLPQAFITGKIAAYHLLGLRSESQRLLVGLLTRKKLLRGIGFLMEKSPSFYNLFKSSFLQQSEYRSRFQLLSWLCVGETNISNDD